MEICSLPAPYWISLLEAVYCCKNAATRRCGWCPNDSHPLFGAGKKGAIRAPQMGSDGTGRSFVFGEHVFLCVFFGPGMFKFGRRFWKATRRPKIHHIYFQMDLVFLWLIMLRTNSKLESSESWCKMLMETHQSLSFLTATLDKIKIINSSCPPDNPYLSP